jgi:hypothetical protein
LQDALRVDFKFPPAIIGLNLHLATEDHDVTRSVSGGKIRPTHREAIAPDQTGRRISVAENINHSTRFSVKTGL